MYVSPNCREISGYEPEELLGSDSLQQVHPDDRENLREQFGEFLITGASSRREFRSRHRDGSWFWLESVGRLVRNAAGEIRVVIVSRDITERKRAEEALRALEDR